MNGARAASSSPARQLNSIVVLSASVFFGVAPLEQPIPNRCVFSCCGIDMLIHMRRLRAGPRITVSESRNLKHMIQFTQVTIRDMWAEADGYVNIRRVHSVQPHGDSSLFLF